MNVRKFNNYRAQKIGHSATGKVSMHGKTAQIENNLNLAEQNHIEKDQDIDSHQEIIKRTSKTRLQKEHCKCDMSPATNTDNTLESPKGISPKTQELLNRSYWEYYNKLKHKMKSTGSMEQQYLYQLKMKSSKTKNEKTDELNHKELQSQLKLNPEFQTLQQCSALSSMINKAL